MSSSEDALENNMSSDSDGWTKSTQSSRSYTPSNMSTISSNTSTQSTQTDCSTNTLNGDGNFWYSGKCFDRYWNHYYRVMEWCRKHKHAFRTLNEQFHKPSAVVPEFSNLSSIYSRMHHPYNSDYHKYYRQNHVSLNSFENAYVGRGRKHRNRQKEVRTSSRNGFASASKSDRTSDVKSPSSSETSEEFEMQITDEMLTFFAQSQKHRQERDAVRNEENNSSEKEVKRTNIEEVSADKNEPTVEAPKERPGARRTAEMKEIYGKGAAMIHGMETALQMTYDRNSDTKQPKHWPNMPLKLTFD